MTGIVSFLKHQLHYTLSPLLLILTAPNFILILWYIIVHCDGSVLEFYNQCSLNGLPSVLLTIWSSANLTSRFAISVIGGYSLFAVLLQILVPGKRITGPLTPNGNTPVYKDNGFYNYVITMVAFTLICYVSKTYYNVSPTLVYDNFIDILTCLNVYSLLLCLILYFKGCFSPSTTDSGTSGNLIFDYYWGTELYPRIFGVDVKVFTNCRFGLTVWPLLITIFALKSYELHGFVDSMWVSWVLYMAYITKFFWWESGYIRTMDIIEDRAGFYICWGCLVFVPGLYTSVSLYLVSHPVELGVNMSISILVFGMASLIINYLADKQKQDVRQSDGKCTIWGRRPEIIRAKYKVHDGSTHQSILLVSGYWGISRHFHYVPELCLAFAWTVPAMFTHISPYFYLIFLFVLLVHRSYRDDKKCSEKYGVHWKQYCKKVPYKILPPFL